MAGVAVAVSGVIGFVGLVVPHIVRLMVGSDHRRVLPVGALFGASFMVLGDLLARTIVAPQEMPIGVITAFIGAPTLIVLIRRRPYLYGAPVSLELQDLSVDIAGRRIVSDIGFTVPDGSFAGLLGPNGSGKSTILKAIYRVHRPAAGASSSTARTCWRCGPGTPPGGSPWWPRNSRSSSTSRSSRWS